MVFKRKLGKKGGIHVDWAISMGLFLVYVVLLFILLRPGAYALHKPESLFTIIEHNFPNNTMIIIKEIQFGVKHCIEGREVILEDTKRNYKFSEIKKVEGNIITTLTKENFQNEPGVEVGSTAYIYCSNDPTGYDPWIGDDEKKFITISYPKDYENLEDVTSLPSYSIECKKSPKSPNPPADTPGKACSAKLGAVSEFTGFYKEYLNYWADKSSRDLQKFKEDWGFPPGKTFRIKINTLRGQDPNNPNFEILIGDKSIIPEGVSVFVKEYNSILIDKYNFRENIKIHIDVW